MSRVLAAELGYQRGVYQIEDDVRLGDRYDDSRMVDSTSTADANDELYVCCIISRGWVKRASQGAEQVRVCKTRVLVTTKDNL